MPLYSYYWHISDNTYISSVSTVEFKLEVIVEPLGGKVAL